MFPRSRVHREQDELGRVRRQRSLCVCSLARKNSAIDDGFWPAMQRASEGYVRQAGRQAGSSMGLFT
jgi:hypothetical protein